MKEGQEEEVSDLIDDSDDDGDDADQQAFHIERMDFFWKFLFCLICRNVPESK